MYDQGNAEELRHAFWKDLADSPFVMLQLDDDPDTAAPMTAQLDKDANSAIWFFTYKDNRFAEKGAATATFASKGHDLFARFHGRLVEETSRERLEKEWSNTVEAWFPNGRNDPKLLMLRMDLGEASIWSGKLGPFTTAKMLLGMDITDDVKGGKADTSL
ncbi:pyridoxamine 5'-phosphate oxidase family protein [Croceicoccus sp. F390]|uniref:Pyridoxamine 5'-phosphate oxidase family protein n=1 Tax=Croceicoccus esteveae TaxID=3075597 RepID=A0ABU2ZM71_9SPHN|nr:pyridoxamine 5'-phosphate oxidase family protein [Croceicoccus sp. F390]MDT0576674.1 pyridoxamine 5'-phosphate oxidase family protein [Croceicoccus sp. F390]